MRWSCPLLGGAQDDIQSSGPDLNAKGRDGEGNGRALRAVGGLPPKASAAGSSGALWIES